jgi:3-phenylpropionate/trans-cinnamate dioxygenase ferredoxin reductase subunit
VADHRTFVIAGAGLAGAKAAETLREEGYDGRIVLVGAEPERPYERPPLSKGYLNGTSAREETHVHTAAFYAEHDIELLTSTLVTAVHPDKHEVDLAVGETLSYDRLLIATGALPRRLPIAGSDLDGVVVLRTLADADVLRDRVARGGRLAVIGAGWIGCEAGASARQLGADVTLVEYAATPLERVLGAELGGFYADVQRDHGVNVLTGARVERIEGGREGLAVRLADGTAVECDTVLVGVGVEPDTRLGRDAGLAVDDGIVVDELLRTTAPDVFAAGDVASALHPRYGRHVRVEHWANAIDQGSAAARSMLDRGEPYVRVPYFFSDQYDVGMEYTGLHAASDRLVLRGSAEARTLQAFWLDAEGRVTAGMHVNDWDAMEAIKRLVEGQAALDPQRLADAEVPLDDLAPASSGSS